MEAKGSKIASFLFPFISFYFHESRFFNGLRPIEIKKPTLVSGCVQNVSAGLSLLIVRAGSQAKRIRSPGQVCVIGVDDRPDFCLAQEDVD
jgi:hypothetical protein